MKTFIEHFWKESPMSGLDNGQLLISGISGKEKWRKTFFFLCGKQMVRTSIYSCYTTCNNRKICRRSTTFNVTIISEVLPLEH